MKKISPYIIQHIELEEPVTELSFPLLHEAGYYCFFWWRDIPLGHLFVDTNQKPDSHELRKRILTAIHPTIDFYIARQELRSVYRKAFLNANQPLFEKVMNNIFSAYLPVSIPEVVDISVIICTRDRSEDLDLCLQSLFKQVCRPKEIIVVDNAPSNDATKKVVARYNHVIYCAEPRPGLSIARNTGVRHAGCPIIAWTDDDVTVHPLWAYRIWEAFQVSEIVAVTGLVIAAQLDTESQQIFERFWPFNRGYRDKVFDTVFFEAGLQSGPPVWNIGAGANMAFRKSIFDELGYFDERLGAGASGCNEDSEMWFRILAKGYFIHYTPRAVVFHKHREQMAGLKKQLFSYMKGFITAALIQQSHYKRANYRRHIFRFLPKYYIHLFMKGFPGYRSRYQTLLTELSGVIAGFSYYRKCKKKLPQTNS